MPENLATGATAAQTEAHNLAVARFKKADKTERKLIVSTFEKKPLDLLINCITARQMWIKLNAVYEMKSEENLSLLQKQFFEFKWDESETRRT